MSRLVKYYGIKVPRGQYIFREGDDADALYMIHRGRVEIRKGSGTHDEKIQVLGEGQFIGEMAIIDSLPRSADALAIDDCELIRMDKTSFDKAIRKNSDFAVNVIQYLSQRLRETDEHVSVLARRERTLQVYTRLLREFMVRGKRDATGRWLLLRREYFMQEMICDGDWNERSVNVALADLLSGGRALMKRDRRGIEWLAEELPG